MKIKLELKWNDLWVGAYWKNKELSFRPGRWTIFKKERHIWICIFPCLPIHIWYEIKKKRD